MNHRFQWKKKIMAYVVAGVLCAAGGSVCTAETAWAVPVAGVPAVDGVNVRDSAVDGAIQDSIQSDRLVTISAETTGTDGKQWYQISYEKNGITIVGWVRSDLLDTSEEAVRAVQEAQTDLTDQEPEDEAPAEDGIDGGIDQAQTVEVTMGSRKINLYDVPEEEVLMLSPDFTAAICSFDSGSVTAYQMLSDRFMGSDSDDYYYVYGQDEYGEDGWYVYHTESGTLQPCMINMRYEESEVPQAPTDTGDSMSKMLVAGLGVISLLLLILVIIFAVRCRILRKYVQEDAEEFLDEPEEEEIEIHSRREKKQKKEIPETTPVRTVIHEKVPAQPVSDKLTAEDVYNQMLESQDLFTPEMSYSDSDLSKPRTMNRNAKTNRMEETPGEYDFPVPEDADYDLKGDFTGRLPNEERQLEELLSLSLEDDFFDETANQNPDAASDDCLPEIGEPEFYDEEVTASDKKHKNMTDDFDDLEFL